MAPQTVERRVGRGALLTATVAAAIALTGCGGASHHTATTSRRSRARQRPDGTKAIVVAERLQRLDVRDPHDWHLIGSIPVPYAGVDHLDFSADGRTLLASAEFSGWVVKVDLASMRVVDQLHVGGQPIDVKLSPDG